MVYKIDLFAIFIFLGIVQAIFLSVFFFSAENRKVQSNFFNGLLLISLALCILETFLMYTGYIVHCLYLVDFSEPIAFVIGPSLYLMVLSTTRGRVKKIQYLHFAFAVIYLVLVFPFFLMPEAVKYNSWIESYNLDLPMRPYDCDRGDPRIFWITDHHTQLTLLSLVVYAILSLVEVIRTFRQRAESFLKPQNPGLAKIRAGAAQIAITTVFILVIKYFNPNDTGDHIFSAYIAVIIYMTSFRVMRQSGFFKQASLIDPVKYKGSQIPEPQQASMLKHLQEIMTNEKPFLKSDFSLPDLAKQLGTTVHTLSQVINTGLGKSFFEMTAEYRVTEAKKLLKEKTNIKVEEIAEQVGYNSKSSFNIAFKKFTGQTPSEFRSGS
jgi:AraC-like DNA-binding protein